MLAKLALSVLIGGGSVAMGAAPALAAAPGSAGSNSPSAHCGQGAEKMLTFLEHADSRISALLPKLQAAEQKAQSADHPKIAARIAKRITRLEGRQKKVDGRVAKIEQRCPGLATTSGSTTSS